MFEQAELDERNLIIETIIWLKAHLCRLYHRTTTTMIMMTLMMSD